MIGAEIGAGHPGSRLADDVRDRGALPIVALVAMQFVLPESPRYLAACADASAGSPR
jgi:hypothetical protein